MKVKGWACLPGLAFFSAWLGAGPLQIDYYARALQPGEVVLLRVLSEEPLGALEGEFLKRRVAFFAASTDQRSWQALLGIDLQTQEGPQRLTLTGRTSSGERVEASRTLHILAKTFPTRHLQVDERFVHPPAEVLERIRRESQLLSSTLRQFSPRRQWEGSFLPPVPGKPTSSFGKRSILNGQPRSPHTGTDFQAALGTPIRAPNHGRVTLAQELYYSGKTVVLDHGLGLFSLFAHLSELSVEVGQEVSKGQLLGKVGASGRVTGPHLHWAVRLNESRVDPLSLMEAAAQVEQVKFP